MSRPDQMLVLDEGRRGLHYAAACVRVDPETFYPLDMRPDSAAVTLAKAVCAGCPVRKTCLTDVMVSEDPTARWGITAGLTPAERSARYIRDHATHTAEHDDAGVAA